jgi:hypothetical protein
MVETRAEIAETRAEMIAELIEREGAQTSKESPEPGPD